MPRNGVGERRAGGPGCATRRVPGEHGAPGRSLLQIRVCCYGSPVSRSGGDDLPVVQDILPMTLETTLKTAILNLRSGSLEREEEVKVAVILPILNALDWNSADPGSLRPEYPAGSGRVDYALLCNGRPQVFVEAKRRGALDAGAEAQLFGYAVNNGVPLLVLSDGLCWDFYLSMADGRPEERRFHRLELRDEDRVPEYSETLEACFRKRQVASGAARRGAELRLEANRSRTRAREAMPDAWNALLNGPDELLCDLLADKVHARAGIEPDRSDVEEFLQRLMVARPSAGPQTGRRAAEGPRRKNAESAVSRLRRAVGRRQGGSVRVSSVSTAGPAEFGEPLQDIVRDLMRALLEDFPGTLDAETIARLATAPNPLGLKIGNHALLRKVPEGTKIGGHNRYWTQPFAGHWYVCSQWWKADHRHNARNLAAWVESLIGGVAESGARNRLLDILDRLSVHRE